MSQESWVAKSRWLSRPSELGPVSLALRIGPCEFGTVSSTPGVVRQSTFPAAPMPMPPQVWGFNRYCHNVAHARWDISVAAGAGVLLVSLIWLYTPNLAVGSGRKINHGAEPVAPSPEKRPEQQACSHKQSRGYKEVVPNRFASLLMRIEAHASLSCGS